MKERDLLKKTSAFTKLRSIKQKLDIIFYPPVERIIKRCVLKCSGCCGTYGQGGPGFFGLKLKATKEYPEEWLIMTLWSGYDWLTVSGRWVGAHPDQYNIQKPMYSNFSSQTWDEFTPLVEGKIILSFTINKKSMTLKIGETTISLDENPELRPRYAGDGQLRLIYPKDNLRDAFILAPWPWVEI